MAKQHGVPVEKNKEYIVEIEALSSEGSGIARVEGYTMFVPNTAPKDTVRMLAVKTKSGYGYGRVLEILKPSELRTDPNCTAYKRCGGCQLRHIRYDEQLRLKSSIVSDALQRIGGFSELPFEGILGMDNPTRYRNKMIFPVGNDKLGEPICGFYAERSHNIIPLKDCELGGEENEPILRAVLRYMKESGVSAYDETTHTGLIRRIFIRKGYRTGQIMVVISINDQRLPKEQELSDTLRAAEPQIVSIVLNTNTKRTNLVLGDTDRTLWGKSTIEDELLGIRYEISAHSFYQVNPVQTERLYEKAIEYAALKPHDRLMDIYCGIGTISLSCAKQVQLVVGVEIVPEAIENARLNAKRNGIKNVRFLCGSAEDTVPKLIAQGERPTAVILDPPRKGADEQTLRAIVQAHPERIVYVSCNPATLARDLKQLAQSGYKIKRVTAVDMFPHTVHVETIALLQNTNM